MRKIRYEDGRRRAAFAAWVVLFGVACASHVGAQGHRPSELPYPHTPEEARATEPVATLPGLRPDYQLGPREQVLVSDYGLRPSVARVTEGETVFWESISKSDSTIVFEREVARKMICHQLVNFAIQDDEIRSAPLRTGETASFCELRPGKYRYRVIRRNPHHAGAGGSARRLEGWIVVEARATPDAQSATSQGDLAHVGSPAPR